MINNPAQQRAQRAHRPTRPAVRAVDGPDHQARLSWRLGPRDRWIMRMIHEHRVLTAHQITAMAFPSYRSGRQRLRELYLWNVLDRFQPYVTTGGAPNHYVLGPAGATALAAEEGLERRDLGYRHDRALGIAHSLQLAHTVGVNEWFTALVTTSISSSSAGAAPTARLEAWWSETRCHRHFGDLVRPDGYGRYTDTVSPAGTIEFFLEYDLGTEALVRVASKLAPYADLAAATGIATPVLIWMQTARREAGARKLLARAWRDLREPATVPVATAAADLLDPDDPNASPADAVWLPLHQPHPSTDGRLRLTDLPQAWPQLAAPVLTDPDTAPAGSAAQRFGNNPVLLPPVAPTPPSDRTSR